MKEDNVVLVNKNDEVLGEMPKMQAHELGELHRAVSVFIINSKGEWLLQQRAAHKYHSHSLWTNTCCTHPFLNESYFDAAHRRLEEEMGMKTTLENLFNFIYFVELEDNLIEHELDYVFIGVSDELPQINTDEVMNYAYKSYDTIVKEIEKTPEVYTFWFKHIITRVNEQIQQFKNI